MQGSWGENLIDKLTSIFCHLIFGKIGFLRFCLFFSQNINPISGLFLPSLFTPLFPKSMKPVFIFLLFLGASGSVAAQDQLHVSYGCAFLKGVKNTDPYVWPAGEEAQKIVNDICKVVGIPQSFDLRSGNTDNAYATQIEFNRIIVYNPVFIKNFNRDAHTQWAVYTVLAHEVGHHIANHNFMSSDPKVLKKQELEADKFAGSVLRSLGAGYDEAKSGVETLTDETESQTHPPKSARVAALVNGWIEKD